MPNIEAKFTGGKGGFYIADNGEQLGEMTATIEGSNMTVHHTEVKPEAEGKGYAGQLLEAMAEYARQHQLRVIAECRYVQSKFKRNHELYADIWKPV